MLCHAKGNGDGSCASSVQMGRMTQNMSGPMLQSRSASANTMCAVQKEAPALIMKFVVATVAIL